MVKRIIEKLSLEKIPPNSWALTFFLITTLITGASLYWRTISIEEQKTLFEQRKYAYQEFFNGSAKYWESNRLYSMAKKEKDPSRATELRKEADKQYKEYLLLHHQARFKIAVNSDAKVVKAIYDWLNVLDKPECEIDSVKLVKDVAMYQAIRKEAKAKGYVADSVMALVLFNCRLKK